MKYDHMVKINGKYYSSRENVPEEDFSSNEESLKTKSREENEEGKYTKTEINRMSTSELQTLAERSGIENAFDKSGGELKRILIEKFSL